MLVDDAEILQRDGHELGEQIVVIAAQVNDAAFVLGGEADDVLKKVTVLFGPFTAFAQLPAINDVAVQDQGLTLVVLQKVEHLFGFAGFDAEVDVRKNNGFVECLH